MEIVLEGILSDELVEKARGQNINYLVCGVDVYRTIGCAAEDNVEFDRARPRSFRIPLATGRHLALEKFFSGRHYRIIYLEDELDDYDPYTTIGDIKDRFNELRAQGFAFLQEELLEQEDGETAYVLTPLTENEMDELMRED